MNGSDEMTLMVAGLPLTFRRPARLEACRPPRVPVAKPGPCPGGRAGRKVMPKAVSAAPGSTGVGWLQGLNAQGVQEAVSRRHPDVEISVHRTNAGDLHLQMIRVREGRGQGKAQAAMQDLTAAADHLRMRMTLTPEPMPGDTKTRKARLVAWYKSHGFVENKGRSKDLEISAGMYREPRP